MTRQEAISYMLSTHKSIAHELFGKGEFIHTLGDAHIYINHVNQVKLQLTREPRPLPRMALNPDVKNIFDFKYEDFMLIGYDPYPHIKGEVAI